MRSEWKRAESLIFWIDRAKTYHVLLRNGLSMCSQLAVFYYLYVIGGWNQTRVTSWFVIFLRNSAKT